MSQTLNRTLIIRLSLVVICVNLVVSLLFYVFSIHLKESEFQSAIERETNMLADSFTQQVWVFDLNAIEQLANIALENSYILGLRVSDHENSYLIDKGTLDQGDTTKITQQLVHPSGVSVGTLEVSYRDTNREKLVGFISKTTIITVITTIIVTMILISLLLRRHVLKPLISLKESMSQVASGEFKKSYLTNQREEIQSIVEVFNQMAAALEMREIQQATLEAEIRQKHKMEAVGVLAGGMAHNFNNNLAIILGNLELAQLKCSKTQDVAGFLDTAKTALLRSRDLVKQIMIYTRQDAHSLEVFSPSDVVNETVRLLHQTVPSSVNFSFESSPDVADKNIEGDSTRLQEALINLCNNSIHAMEEKGSLTIRLDSCTIRKNDIPQQFPAQPGEYVRIQVIDTGCGIPEDLQEKIFDPFFTTKEMHEGTGMGLSTVRGIIDQHEGFIKVHSQPEQGATIELYFPQTTTQRKKLEEKETEITKGSENLLFVDDDEMLAKMGKDMLTSLGYQVTSLTDAHEAYDLIQEYPDRFDLVLTDQTMPGMTGAEFIKKLKSVRTDLPVILCTGYSSQVTEKDARRLGAEAFCMKPLEMNELATTIRKFLT